MHSENNKRPYDDNDILNPEFSPTASATEMTGLIPAGITDGEINPYGNVFPYLAGGEFPDINGNPDDIE